ncbi:hypothetical protein AGMMS49982_16300 [Bacteroidia bacterium]|nr:hypothetical protein AGMMS49982_16300 [Bacteroidia bacterium]
MCVLRFDNYNEAWLDFIILNRKNKTRNSAHDYDIIEGPVADDAVAARVNDYLQGKVSKEDFLIELIHKKPSHQLCFCTLQSLLMLERTDNKAECDIYHIDDQIIQQLITDKELSDTQASNLYFNSHTYKQLIDESTDIYQKPWTEIYQMFLRELNTATSDLATRLCRWRDNRFTRGQSNTVLSYQCQFPSNILRPQ